MNIYECSSSTVQMLPSSVLQFTDKLVVQNTNIPDLCRTFNYFHTIQAIDLRKNSISTICKSYADKLENFSINSRFQSLWLSENPFYCDCFMIWMIKWLNNFIVQGKHAVVDYRNVTCGRGKMKETPIYILNSGEMGCFKGEWKPWQTTLVVIAACFLGAIIIALCIIIKYKRDVRFFLHHYCGCVCVYFGIPKDDQDEQLQRMSYDAFLAYR